MTGVQDCQPSLVPPTEETNCSLLISNSHAARSYYKQCHRVSPLPLCLLEALPTSFFQAPPSGSPAASTGICAGLRWVDGAPSFVLWLHHLADGTRTGVLDPACG